MRESVTYTKSKAFAIRIIRMYQWISDYKKEYVLSKQCLRSGTSIGANLSEGMNGQSKADFISKLHISLKETYETQYWLELLHETGYITNEMFESINLDCTELIKLLTASINTAKKNLNL